MVAKRIEACENCYYSEMGKKPSFWSGANTRSALICHLNPPVNTAFGPNPRNVEPHDWCGQFREREE